MAAPEPDYKITKPSGTSVLIKSRTPSSDVGGIIVTSRDSATNLINETSMISVGSEGEDHCGDSNDSGLGLRPPVSGQVESGSGEADEERGRAVAGVSHEISSHAEHFPRVKKRLTDWDMVCGGPNGFCTRPRCIRARSLE